MLFVDASRSVHGEIEGEKRIRIKLLEILLTCTSLCGTLLVYLYMSHPWQPDVESAHRTIGKILLRIDLAL